MAPELFKVFAAEFVPEWNRLQADIRAEHDATAAELSRIRSQIEGLVDAIAEGTPAAAVRDRLGTLEARRMPLEAELSTPPPFAPRLHPNLAEVCREKVAALTQALAAEDATDARELVRSLVEEIRLIPEDRRLRVEVRGELAAILALAGGGKNNKDAGNTGALAKQSSWLRGSLPPLPNSISRAFS